MAATAVKKARRIESGLESDRRLALRICAPNSFYLSVQQNQHVPSRHHSPPFLVPPRSVPFRPVPNLHLHS